MFRTHAVVRFIALFSLFMIGKTKAQTIQNDTVVIPGTAVSFQLALLPAGVFQMGSKANDSVKT